MPEQEQLSKNQKKKARQKARKAQLAEAEAAQKARSGEDAAAAAAKNRQTRQQELQGKGKAQGNRGGPNPNWAVGVLCEAQYTDGKWYAAKITEKVGKGVWRILYTDYNEEAVLKSAKMRMRTGDHSGGYKQKQGQGKGKKKQHAPPVPEQYEDDEEDEDDEDYDPDEDSGEEEEEDRSGLVVASRKRVKAHKIGCLSAFPHIGSRTALPVPDREVASHLEEGMEVLVKGKTGSWMVVGIARNKAKLTATEMEQAESQGMNHMVLLRDIILDEEQLENEVQTPTKKERLLQLLSQLQEFEEEEEEEEDDDDEGEQEEDSESTPVGQISFNFAAARTTAANAGTGGATGGVFGFSSSSSPSTSDCAPSPAPGSFSFSFGGGAAAATAPPTFDGGKFNFKPLGSVAATPAPAPTSIGTGAFAFKLPGADGDTNKPKQQTPVDEARSSSPSVAARSTLTPYQQQVATLTAFYARVDSGKDETACRAIIDKRRGTNPALSEAEFTKLCQKLQEKYKEDPKKLYSEAMTSENKTPENGNGDSDSSSREVEGTTEAERSFNRQVDMLTKFYAKYDTTKTRQDCAGIIRKRSGCGEDESVPIDPKDWVKLCGKLGKKYGEDPLALGVM